MYINNTRELKSALRAGPHAWPGGYPIYFVTADSGALAFKTVRTEFRHILDAVRRHDDNGWLVIGAEINWEDGELFDSHTNERIESAYAE